jgi:hypothetical protein
VPTAYRRARCSRHYVMRRCELVVQEWVVCKPRQSAPNVVSFFDQQNQRASAAGECALSSRCVRVCVCVKVSALCAAVETVEDESQHYIPIAGTAGNAFCVECGSVALCRYPVSVPCAQRRRRERRCACCCCCCCCFQRPLQEGLPRRVFRVGLPIRSANRNGVVPRVVRTTAIASRVWGGHLPATLSGRRNCTKASTSAC